jgi:hypothetical protein
MKRWLVTILTIVTFLISNKVSGQILSYTFVDPCTQAVTVFSIPAQGTVVFFLNQSRSFTPADVASGALASWINQVYAAYRLVAPCGQQQGQVTQNQITTQIISSTVQSVVGSIMSSAQSASAGMNVNSSSSGNNNKSGNQNNSGSSTAGSNNNGGNNTTSSGGNSGGSGSNSGGSTNNGSGGSTGSSGGSGAGSGGSGSGSNGGGTTTGGSTTNTGGSTGSSGGGSTSNGGSTTGSTTQSGQSSGEKKAEEVAATTTMNVDAHNGGGESGGESSSSGGGKGGGKSSSKSSNSNPMLVQSDLTTAQNLDKSFTPILNLGISQASMTGASSWGVTSMTWLNFRQFALSARYTSMIFNKTGTVKYISNFNLTGVYSYGNILGFVGYSGILNAGKYGVTGFNASVAATLISEDKSSFFSPSLTAFYTKPFMVGKKLTISPELYVISTPLIYSSKEEVFQTDRTFSGFIGSGFDYQISKRFKFNINYKANLSTNPDFPILSFFLIGSKVNL